MKKEELIELSSKGYEDLTLSSENLINFINKYSSEFPILVGDNEVWVHINNNISEILFETDIGENTKIIKL